MIPILYEATETAFLSNGIGRLRDMIEATVYEERNGPFYMEFKYPVTGVHFDDITEGRIVACTHDSSMDVQPFVIMSSEKPIDGVVTFAASHLSYRLFDYSPGLANAPFSNLTAQQIMDEIAGGLSTVQDQFVLETSIPGTTATWGDPIPRSCREWLGGTEGSLLDKFPGEYKFDRWNVYLLQSRGELTNVLIKYGKNITGFKVSTDYSEAYTDLRPYYNGDYASGASGVIMYPYVSSGYTLPGERKAVRAIDFTDQIDGKGKQAQAIQGELHTLAKAYLAEHKPWEPKVTMDVEFVQLWQTNEYAQYVELMECCLCDTVRVDIGMYGINEMLIKVVAVEWDALRDRYNKMTLGGIATSLSQVVNSGVSGSIQANANAISNLDTRTASVTLLDLTRTTNNYVGDDEFNRMLAYRTGAKTGVLYLNLQLSSTMPSGTALTQIGTLSGATPLVSHLATVPCQSNNSTLLVELTTAGVINIGNFSGTATGTNFFRAVIPLTFS